MDGRLEKVDSAAATKLESQRAAKPLSRTPYSDATQCKKAATHVKRPMNAFMVWSRMERRKINVRLPALHNAEISRRLGRRWRSLSDAQRRPFVEEAVRLRYLHLIEYPGYKYQPRKKGTTGTTTTTAATTADRKSEGGPSDAKSCSTKERFGGRNIGLHHQTSGIFQRCGRGTFRIVQSTGLRVASNRLDLKLRIDEHFRDSMKANRRDAEVSSNVVENPEIKTLSRESCSTDTPECGTASSGSETFDFQPEKQQEFFEPGIPKETASQELPVDGSLSDYSTFLSMSESVKPEAFPRWSNFAKECIPPPLFCVPLESYSIPEVQELMDCTLMDLNPDWMRIEEQELA